MIRRWWADLPDNHLFRDPRLVVILAVFLIGMGGGMALAQYADGRGPVPWLGLAAVTVAVAYIGLRFVRAKYGVSGPPRSGYVLEKPIE